VAFSFHPESWKEWETFDPNPQPDPQKISNQASLAAGDSHSKISIDKMLRRLLYRLLAHTKEIVL
jgi:hypothetical protein